MKLNPVKEIERIGKFLNLDLQPEEIEQVCRMTSFESMSKNPTTNYQHWDTLGLRDKGPMF
jgi:hypothetical protein